jgi:hypothetical protein
LGVLAAIDASRLLAGCWTCRLTTRPSPAARPGVDSSVVETGQLLAIRDGDRLARPPLGSCCPPARPAMGPRWEAGQWGRGGRRVSRSEPATDPVSAATISSSVAVATAASRTIVRSRRGASLPVAPACGRARLRIRSVDRMNLPAARTRPGWRGSSRRCACQRERRLGCCCCRVLDLDGTSGGQWDYGKVRCAGSGC